MNPTIAELQSEALVLAAELGALAGGWAGNLVGADIQTGQQVSLKLQALRTDYTSPARDACEAKMVELLGLLENAG